MLRAASALALLALACASPALVMRTEAPPPERAALAERAAEHGADGAVFVRLVLRKLVRETHTLRYLASTASFGILPFAVMHDQLDYALEFVAVGAGSGALVAQALATRSVGQDHTLWQTAEGDLFGWDVGEAIGEGRRRRRALDSEVADALLAEAAGALAPASATVPLVPRD